MDVRVHSEYLGGSDWLCMCGGGEKVRNAARLKQVASGGRVACFDFGYFGRSTDMAVSYMRVSIDHHHPQADIGKTKPDPSRWDKLRIVLREDANPNGHIVVVGLGPKSRDLLSLYDWEMRALESARRRFPGKTILYRPKRDAIRIMWEPQDATSPIEEVLRGASLVISRHSNVACDACVAGIPVECEDGAAAWIYRDRRSPDAVRRLDFLRRLAWWQWQLGEMGAAWKFLLAVSSSTSAAGSIPLTVM